MIQQFVLPGGLVVLVARHGSLSYWHHSRSVKGSLWVRSRSSMTHRFQLVLSSRCHRPQPSLPGANNGRAGDRTQIHGCRHGPKTGVQSTLKVISFHAPHIGLMLSFLKPKGYMYPTVPWWLHPWSQELSKSIALQIFQTLELTEISIMCYEWKASHFCTISRSAIILNHLPQFGNFKFCFTLLRHSDL